MPPAWPAQLSRLARLPDPTSRGAALRGLLLAVVLLLAPQPVPLRVAQDLHAAAQATRDGDYATAADALADAAARLPYVSELVYRAGLAQISAGRFDSAVRHLLSAAAADGWTPARRIAAGDAYLGQGEREAALVQWELAREAVPADEGVLARLATNYEAVGRYPEAIQALAALARSRPADSAVHVRLALLTAATTPPQALSRLAVAAEVAPEFAPTAQSLRQAIEAGQAAGDEAYTSTLVGAAFIQLKEWALARLALARALALNPEYADAHAYFGLVQDMLGEDGLAAYEKAVALAPDSPFFQFLLALHWRRLGESNTALPYLKTAHALDPQNPAIIAEIGGAYASLGDLISAEINLAQAVMLDEQNPQFWLLLARFYVDHEYHVADLGVPAAQQAVALSPNSAAALDALGYALVLTGDPADGEKMLQQALALDAHQPSTHYHLGVLYARQGELSQAEQAFNLALALDPEGPYGGLALKALAQFAP